MRIGFVGAGNYATSMLLPHLASDGGAHLATVATTRSLSAVNAQRKFGFATMTTDASSVLADPDLDAVFVVTRHASHADFVCRALESGKAVFVEKPLALTEESLERVVETIVRTGNDRLMVGFNRRFAPLFTELRSRFGPVDVPVSARYLVNAGRLDPTSWYLNEELEGSRFLGEGGHFIDTLSAFIGHDPVEVHAQQTPGGGDLHVTLRFADGSLGAVTYATGGDGRFPKETLDVTGGGRNARLDNFTRATVWGRGGKDTKRSLGQDKGQKAQLAAFVEAVRTGAADADRLGVARGHHAGDHRGRHQPLDRAGGGAVSRSVGWYARRLRRMSPAEITSRTRDEVRRRTWAHRQVLPGVTPDRVAGLRENRHFPTPLPSGTQEMVPPAARAATVAAADRILAGDWTLLGAPRTDIADPDWFLDPVTGRRAPQGRLAFKIDHRDEAETGNVKAVWELSRHHHLTVLAAAWWLTGDARYAEAVDRQLRSWWTANPFLSGVHWTSGIELGVRLSAWAWVRRLLDDWSGAAALFEDNPDALRQIRWHQEYLDAFRSRGSSANNHVVAEACGRLAGACAFPWYDESDVWRADAARQLEHQLAANTFPSGINRELATDYHRFVTELGIVAAAEADAVGHPLDDATWTLLTASLDAAAALTDASGRPPRQGDGDEGRALVLDDPEADPWAQLLDLGAGVVGALPWWPETTGTLTSAVVSALLSRRVDVADRPGEAPRVFADAGIALLRTPVERRTRDLVPLRRWTARFPVHRSPRSRGRPVRRGPPRRCRGAGGSRHVLLPRRARLAELLPVHPGAQHPRVRRHQPGGRGRAVPLEHPPAYRGHRGGPRTRDDSRAGWAGTTATPG